MKNIELQLKELILSKYKSIREFAGEIEMPYSTIDSIIKRGVDNASITNIIKICKALNISADMLAQGEIRSTKVLTNSGYTQHEMQLIENYRSLNQEGQEKVTEYVDDLVSSGKYIKNCTHGMVEEKQA